MANNEELARKAISYIEIAQKSEEEKDFDKAIYNYQLAIEALQNSGYMVEGLKDLYARIETLKKGKQMDKVYQHQQIKAKIEQIQEQAFSLIDVAQRLEKENRIEEAIYQYNAAINLFMQAGWTDFQLQNFRDKIEELGKRPKISPVPPQISSPEVPEVMSPIEEPEIQVLDAFGEKKSAKKAEELKRYRELKTREENVQEEAFKFIDNAKFYENNNQFDEAIECYKRAIELLNSIGWQDQTKNLYFLIEKLKRDKGEFERTKEKSKFDKGESLQKPEEEKQIKAEQVRVIEQEALKSKRERVQSDAFNFIDLGKKFDREKQYEQAIQTFQKAIELFNSIELDAYVQPIINFINDVKQKQQSDIELERISKKREDQLRNLQDSIFVKKKEELVQTARDIEQKRREYEKEKQEIKRREEIFFSKLTEADKALKEGKNLEQASKKYQEALEDLKNLGGGWESYIDMIQSTITSINTLQREQLIRLQSYQKREDLKTQSEIEFQDYISKELDKERAKIKQRELDLEVRKDELEYREQRKDAAFKAFEEAQAYINKKDYENAILAYQAAGNIFAGIHWDDELHLIENAIREIEERKRKDVEERQKQLEKSIQQQKVDLQFQEQISRKLKEEREKLRLSEIKLREREQELSYREKQKEEAFRLLDIAQEDLQKGDYDKAIEIYQNAMNIFAKIQWYDEVEMIGKSILEIRNRKNETGLKKQRELQQILKKEQEENAFHQKIINEMKLQREKLQQKQLILREQEKEVEYRTQRKEEAFRTIDEAQNYLSLGKFDMAIDNYRKVAEIFAQIQWEDELGLITQAIREIEVKKREKEIWKEKTIQQAIERETAYKRFMDQVKHQREVEKIKLEKEQMLLRQKKQLTEENFKHQQKVLAEIENADSLLKQEQYDEAIQIYKMSIEQMKNLGWTESYLRLLNETLQSIIIRKKEKESELERQQLLLQQQREEEEKFYKNIELQMGKEQKRLEKKAVRIQEKEDLKIRMEKRRVEAFDLMTNAEIFLNKGNYDQAVDLYRQAERALSEIQFPTNSIRELILKVQKKKQQKILEEQKELERKIAKEREEEEFRSRIAERSRLNEERMRQREIIIQEKALRKIELEQARKEAFNLLDEAARLTRSGQYEQALELYHQSELKLSEIQFPTNIISDMKFKIQNKIREQQINKQRELEAALKREKENRAHQKQMFELMAREKERLKIKESGLVKKAEEKAELEVKQDVAFRLLDEGQERLRENDFDAAMAKYNNAISIFTEIGWQNEIALLQNSTRAIEKRKKEHEQYIEIEKQKMLQKQREETQFMEDLSNLLEKERERVNQAKISLREHEKEQEYRENRKEEAFYLIDRAQFQLDEGNYDRALQLYYDVEKIFAEIQWKDEIKVIHQAILEIQNRRKEVQLAKQKELESELQHDQEEQEFQQQLINQANIQRENLKRKEIKLREREKELKHLEERREQAFTQLDFAQKLAAEGKLNEAQNYYYNVINIFAEIHWEDEIPLIQQSILELENKKRENQFLKEKQLKQAIQKEKESLEYIQRIRRSREDEKRKLLREKREIEKVKELSTQAKQKQEKAFNMIEIAENLLSEEKFDNALEQYQHSIAILREIGWNEPYLKLLEDTILEIKNRKAEKERIILKEKELRRKRIEEENAFEKALSEQMEKERDRLHQKKVQIKKQEELKHILENRKGEAFNLMDRGEILIKQGYYDQAIETYFQAELILSEIQFPTDAVKEMIHKIQEKKREKDIAKQQELELSLRRQEEEQQFFQKVSESWRTNEEKIRAKEIRLRQKEEMKNYLEQRKDDAFELLDQAEIYVNKTEYDKALEFYRSAELILSEIQYPTDSLKETILKINEKKREQDLQKQQELEIKIQKEREEREFQKKIIENLVNDKERIRKKQIKVEELKVLRLRAEQKREEAFSILDKAEMLTKKEEYDMAIEQYRKAMMILNEVQYPIDGIDAMINKVTSLKIQKQKDRELALERELKKLEEEKKLKLIIEERKRQEQEKLAAQKIDLQQKEEMVQQQMTYREAAFALLEEGGKYLKRRTPDYDRVISLYIQARDLLSEKVGWEPEINNLNQLIKDLTKEKEKFVEKKKSDENLRILRQKEYEAFQQEIRKRRLEYEREQKEQKKKLVQLYETQQNLEQKREEGLELIDKAKDAIKLRNFDSAYAKFRQAIAVFKEIGWEEQAKYIQNEIEHTKILEKRLLSEEERINMIHQELERKKKAEERKKKEEEKNLKEAVSEVGSLTSEISQLITEKKKEEARENQRQRDKIQEEARSFKKDVVEIIDLKKEITSQIAQSKKEQQKRAEKLKYEKDKEKADEIKDLIKKAAKKGKK